MSRGRPTARGCWCNENGARSLWWVDLATRQLTPLALDFARSDRNPRLSPDGREIAYWKIEANGSTNIWTQSLDGGSPHRVTADAESISYPAWSPDGQWLAVQIKRGKDTHVGVVSKNGGPVEQITHATGLSGANSWSPDGDQIAFAGQRDGVWNVWAVSRRTQRQPAADAFHRAERLRAVPVVVARRPPHRVRARHPPRECLDRAGPVKIRRSDQKRRRSPHCARQRDRRSSRVNVPANVLDVMVLSE